MRTGTSGSSYCIGRGIPCSSRFDRAISRCGAVTGIVIPSEVVYLSARPHRVLPGGTTPVRGAQLAVGR
jgi:hypothetical protein